MSGPQVSALVALVLLAGCGEDKRPGNPAVYERIESTSSCARLQGEFNRAMSAYDRTSSKTSLAYADAAQARIDKLDCP